ncbi:MAG TPA: hypothetical protein VFR09_03650 [Alphaproteobacteria bacterium]|nr:hypothetical protein [Alphaproteobacteria bacterium]
MADTSYLPSYAPYASWAARQAPVPANVHNVPATIPGSGNVQSSLIVTEGFSLVSAGITSSQAGTMSIQRYLDAGGTVTQGPAVQVSLSAGVAANLDILDGRPFASMKLTITNASGTTANLTNFALLLQASDQSDKDNAVDGSGVIATGGTAQNLFSGIVPVNGFAIYNPDPSNDLWMSDITTAAANGQGSIRIAANGGGYETPPGYRPLGAVSVYGATTGQKITAKRW